MPGPFDKIGIIGAGSMGSEMALLFAEHGLSVSLFDVAGENVDKFRQNLEKNDLKSEIKSRITSFKSEAGKQADGYGQLVDSLGGKHARKIFVFSIKHGSPADEVIKSLTPFLTKGDVIVDGGNEHYRSTERRQKALADLGVAYVGTGVSGGYQSARHGPSLSPGGDKKVIEEIMPLLEDVSAKDIKTGRPCVTYIGPGGAGHHVKMIHNGIEQGMLAALAETWELLYKCLNQSLDSIGELFGSWSAQGEMRRTFLLEIGADICKQPNPDPSEYKAPDHQRKAPKLLNEVQDKVVQDADDTEGTGVWSVMDAAQRHVSAPTIAAAHFLRVASADRQQRLEVVEKLGQDMGAARKQQIQLTDELKEDLRMALYGTFLASFAQGLNLIAKASEDEGWGVDLSSCIRIWREGCIIRVEGIADLLEPVLEKKKAVLNVLTLDVMASEVRKALPHLKKVVQLGLEWNAHIPAMSASLEYFKYCAGPHLPTQFMEAQLDYFGAHSFDLKDEGAGSVKKGPHHFEWSPA